MTEEDLLKKLSTPKESETLEFKEAKEQMSILGSDGKEKKSLYGYSVALGNEGGGLFILGVKDKINFELGRRDIVGTNAIQNIEQAKSQIFEKLKKRIEIEEFNIESKRVLVIKIPSHSMGETFKFFGVNLMRSGENLVEMDDTTLRRIINEGQIDFSSQVNTEFKMDDLDNLAVETLKNKWVQKSRKPEYQNISNEEILRKLLLIQDDCLTNAAVLLLGKEEIITKYFPNSEFSFEWRLVGGKTDSDFRKFYRRPFIFLYEELWNDINARNQRIPFKQGFIELDIWSFDEQSIREAILNAFAHREYFNRTEPVFIKISPEEFSIKSPGGLVHGVTTDNILFSEGKWRNRLLMEVLEKIGLVERAGIGLDRIYTKTISDGKGAPNFIGTDNEYVVLNIPAKVRDLNFVYYLEKVIKEKQIELNHVKDFIELEKIREVGKTDDKNRLDFFWKNKIIEKTGVGKGMKYILAKDFYEFIDKKSEYTRKKWLNKEEQKTIILKYLKDHKKGRVSDFAKLFEEKKLTNQQINRLLKELSDKDVYFEGPQRSKSAYWRIKE
ncbi:hypothetical protein EOL99_02840 [Candidatus Falkowbacteria bacterium]|nr:hypothetical protein [Candidatus Falkowbacteria bacterium]